MAQDMTLKIFTRRSSTAYCKNFSGGNIYKGEAKPVKNEKISRTFRCFPTLCRANTMALFRSKLRRLKKHVYS